MTELVAQDLHFAYDATGPVVDGVGLRVERGELVALAGPNGSGKSTLLRLLAGLLPPDGGRVTLDGVDLGRIDDRDRARTIAFLPQTVAPVYSLTARRVVELARYPHRRGLLGELDREGREAVDAALAACDAVEFADRAFETLSGGERQRVLLAGALAQGGRLLLLDEPTSALDFTHQVSTLGRLRDLAASGRAVVVVTHDLNLASTFSTRIVLLREGRVHAGGTAEEVLEERILSEVFGAGLRVFEHPTTGRPCVVPDPEVRR